MVKQIRKREGRKEQLTVGIIDSQSVKSTLVSSQGRGFDAGKHIKDSKRHIVVDVLRLILAVVIQSASEQDRNGAKTVLEKLDIHRKRTRKLFADSGYSGKLIGWARVCLSISVKIFKKTNPEQFEVLFQKMDCGKNFCLARNK